MLLTPQREQASLPDPETFILDRFSPDPGRTMKNKRLVQLVIAYFILWPMSLIANGQTPEMLAHFDYDKTAPLGIKQIGVEKRGDVTIHDITYISPKGGVVPAYLVMPKGKGPFAAVVWGHWYWSNSPMRNRKQFLDEAVALAPA